MSENLTLKCTDDLRSCEVSISPVVVNATYEIPVIVEDGVGYIVKVEICEDNLEGRNILLEINLTEVPEELKEEALDVIRELLLLEAVRGVDDEDLVEWG